MPAATVADAWAAVFAAAPGAAIACPPELDARYRAEARLLRAVVTASRAASGNR